MTPHASYAEATLRTAVISSPARCSRKPRVSVGFFQCQCCLSSDSVDVECVDAADAAAAAAAADADADAAVAAYQLLTLLLRVSLGDVT